MSVKLEVTIDSRQLNVFLNAVNVKTVRKALARSLNRTMITVRKVAAQEIQKGLKLSSKEIKDAIPIKNKASPSQPIASQEVQLGASREHFSFSKFHPTQVSLGVRVNITGSPQIEKHAFIATMPNGGKSVFIRSRYTSKKGTIKRVGKNRKELPIQKVVYKSMVQILPTVTATLQTIATERFQEEFNRNLSYLMKGKA